MAVTSVLCAVDSSELAPRVLKHAAGLAGVCGASLTVLHVSPGNPRDAEGTIGALVRVVVPEGAPYIKDLKIRVVHMSIGKPEDAIFNLVREAGIDLLVAGTHSKSGLSRWLLGSTSVALLEQAVCATMLIPPGQQDIVTLSRDSARFHPGTVMAAVDLDEQHPAQLKVASELARLARQPLALMTVAPDGTSDEVATARLRERAEGLAPAPVERFIVRRGNVALEIDHVAVAEHVGLVVMGLQGGDGRKPGEIATAVLRTKDAAVLAVPQA